MNHDDMRQKLSAYMDDALLAEERAAIEAHLKICLECREALEELRKTVAHVKTLQEIDPPAWMTQKIMAQVRSKTESGRSIWQKLFFPLHIKLPLEAVAAMFCVVIGYYVFQGIQPAVKLAEAPIQYEQKAVVRKEAASPPMPATQPSSEPGKTQRSMTADGRQDFKAGAELQAPAAKAEEERLLGKPAVAYRERQPVPAVPAAPAQTAVERRSAETAAAQTAADEAEPPGDVRARSKVETQAAARPARTLPAAQAPASGVTLVVGDIKVAMAGIKDKIADCGGTVFKTESETEGVVISAAVPPARLEELMDHLNKLGRIRDKHLQPVPAKAPVSIKITITSGSSG